MKITIQLVHAFTNSRFGGCRTGIIPDADNLTPVQKQIISGVMAPLEIAFISISAIADARVEMYNGTQQSSVSNSGLIAVTHYLQKNKYFKGSELELETAGEIITISYKNNIACLHVRVPLSTVTEKDIFRVVNHIGVDTADIYPGLMPQIVTTDKSFLLIPLKDQNVLHSANIDKTVAERLLNNYGLQGICLFTISLSAYTDAICKTIASGSTSENISVFSAAHVGCFLYQNNYLKRTHITIEHGINTPANPGGIVHVLLKYSGEVIEGVWAGGQAYIGDAIKIVIQNETTGHQPYSIANFPELILGNTGGNAGISSPEIK